jgi:hypothetical protein
MTIYILVAVAVGFAVLSWLVGRISERLHYPLAIASGIVTRLCLGTALAVLAGRAAVRGGYAWIEFSLLVLASLWTVVTGGVLIWGVATGRLNDDDEPATGD